MGNKTWFELPDTVRGKRPVIKKANKITALESKMESEEVKFAKIDALLDNVFTEPISEFEEATETVSDDMPVFIAAEPEPEADTEVDTEPEADTEVDTEPDTEVDTEPDTDTVSYVVADICTSDGNTGIQGIYEPMIDPNSNLYIISNADDAPESIELIIPEPEDNEVYIRTGEFNGFFSKKEGIFNICINKDDKKAFKLKSYEERIFHLINKANLLIKS